MRKLLCVVPALLLASCHSQQVAFQFQPAPAMSVPVAAAPAAASPEITVTAVPDAASPATGTTATPTLAKRPRLRPRQVVAALQALPSGALATLATAAPASQHQPLSQRKSKAPFMR